MNQRIRPLRGVDATNIADIRVEHGGGDLWIVALHGEHDLTTASMLDEHLRQVHSHGTRVVLDLPRQRSSTAASSAAYTARPPKPPRPREARWQSSPLPGHNLAAPSTWFKLHAPSRSLKTAPTPWHCYAPAPLVDAGR